ncbi:hypothetical protein B0T17DRAFT_485500 [Bombardia bombarda]|uniref:Uncharacterized protein n=1 Tax=Bombardia bombarda TaxID=252184 RepID=A0AA39XMS2_9PEZI|nr:hypothetical protein B0T17DRAFT_485500 [Bombardia bombarda]
MAEVQESGQDGESQPQPQPQPVAIEGRTMMVLYGSETGNAEEIAMELVKMARRLHFQTVVDEMDSFKLTDLLRYSVVIFVTSTTGQGDMPRNTTKFWRNLLREKLSKTNCLAPVNFAIFGLGDSSYPKFNWAARKLRVRLLQLGASEFFKQGEADERHDDGIDSIFVPWYQELRTTLSTRHPLPGNIKPLSDDTQLPPVYTLRLASTMFTFSASGSPSTAVGSDAGDAPETPSPPTAEELEELAARFERTKTKAAVHTHIENPRSHVLNVVAAAERSRDGTFPPFMARRDDVWENLHNRRVDSLDKDNIITDHPEKYLLHKPHRTVSSLPPEDMLAIPGSYVARLMYNERQTPDDHWQDVRQLTFGIEPRRRPPIITAGTTLVIYPKNYPEDVQSLIDMMGWQEVAEKPLDFTHSVASAMTALSLTTRPKHLYLKERAGKGTLRDLLTHNFDITAIPKRNFVRELMFFTTEDLETTRLRELSSYGSEQEFYDYTSRPRRTILELLRDFPGVKIPFSRVMDMFPIIRGREFSICNGEDMITANEGGIAIVSILVALVKYKTIIRKPREGLCSRYLRHLAPESLVRVQLKPPTSSTLHTDELSARRPLIAVATGTGIAPIRALIQDRDQFAEPGRTLLFFGCRNEKADYFYHDEWPNMHNVEVIPAFSRDPMTPMERCKLPHSSELGYMLLPALKYDEGKNYVQNQIRKHALKVGEMLRENPLVVICGSSGLMPASVRSALQDVLVKTSVVRTHWQAKKWLNEPQNVTIWQETW